LTRGNRTSQADRVYQELRARLLRGDLPIGQRLVEQQLAADFETSRTPVREALRRLEGDGHVVRDPSGGGCRGCARCASCTTCGSRSRS
jgi:DNA-binding GntR family transcriptional regulator